jgi:hypothetical protein
VIKIRYADLPSGLHIQAVVRGKDTIIYLLPGLTVEQRRAALRRVRSSARLGQGPPLSTSGLARALVADRIMTTVRNVASALRVHPAMSVPLIVILLSAAVAYFLLSSVSIKIHSPQAGAPATLLGPPIAAAATPSDGGRQRDPDGPGGLVPGRPPPGQPGPPAPKQPGGGHPSPSPLPSPGPLPTGPVPPGQGLPPGPPPSPDPSPAPWPSGSTSPSTPSSPSPSPTRSGGGLCVDVGLLGVCVTL